MRYCTMLQPLCTFAAEAKAIEGKITWNDKKEVTLSSQQEHGAANNAHLIAAVKQVSEVIHQVVDRGEIQGRENETQE